jgi:hypothetical protein
MARLRRCHGCGAHFQNRKGADLHCSDECAGQHQAAQTMFQESLTKAGFVQVANVPNLWVKDAVHISMEQVMREGLDETLARHREVVNG